MLIPAQLNGSKTKITIQTLLTYFPPKKNIYLDFSMLSCIKYLQCEWWHENVQNGQFKMNQKKSLNFSLKFRNCKKNIYIYKKIRPIIKINKIIRVKHFFKSLHKLMKKKVQRFKMCIYKWPDKNSKNLKQQPKKTLPPQKKFHIFQMMKKIGI